MLVGQVGTDAIDREAFQEVDYRRMYGSVVKWAAQVDRVERIPEYIAQAFRRALAGRPGPVVLALPEDVLTARADVAIPPRIDALPIAPAPADVATPRTPARRRARAAVHRRRTPLGRRRERGAARVRRGAPACRSRCGFRSQDLFDNRHPLYAGDVGIGINPKLAARVRDADVLLVIGERLGEMTTSGYTLLEVPHAAPAADPRDAGRRGDRARVPAGARHRRDARPSSCTRSARGLAAVPAWRDSAAAAHREYDAWRVPRAAPGAVDPGVIVRALDERLPDDAILTNGAGNYTVWLHRAYRYRQPGTQLAPYSGSMGYGVPAAVAAKALYPSRVVVSWNGDGCFLMNGQEVATAVQYGLAVDVRRDRQRHVRHDPHAPGAPLSGARVGHRPRQPRLRGARARVRCARRDGAAHRGVHAGVRARAGQRVGPRCCTCCSIRRR